MSPFSESTTSGYGGCRRCLLVVLSIALYCRAPFAAASRVMVTNALWDRDSVNVRRGVNLTLVCRLELGDDFGGLVGGPPIFRIVHSHADRTLLVADNDNMTSAFARLGRYEVTYSPPPAEESSANSQNGGVRFALIVVKINGVQGEDSGTMACQQLSNDEHIGYCDINVYAAVDEIFITTISPTSSSSTGNDVTRVPNGSEVVLRESLGAGSPSSTGVGCTAIINRGGHRTIPPLVSVIVVVGADGDDSVNATSWFQSTVEKRQTVTDSGLSVYRIVSRLVFVPDRPDAELNGRTIKCIARSEGFNDERLDAVATAMLVVNYIPAILCPSSNVSAAVGSDATFTCTVKSNPVSEITWSAVVGAGELYDVNADSSVRFSSKAVSEDEVDISLVIVNVQRHHYRLFTIRAVNMIGDVTTGVKLVPGFDLVTGTEREPTTTAVATGDAVAPVVVTATVDVIGQAGAEAEVNFTMDSETELASDEQVHVEVERVPDRKHSMQNDAAVVSGDGDKLTTRSSQLVVPSTVPSASINSAMPVMSMDSIASSTMSLSIITCVSIWTIRFSITLVSFIAFAIPRSTAMRLFVHD